MKLSNRISWINFFAVLLLAVPTFSGADPDAGTVKQFELVISQRKLQLEENSVRVTQGETVKMVWHSDEPVTLHLHGYDIEFEVSPDAPANVTFEAHATGRFPITSHSFGGENGHGHETLLYIEVYPD